MLDSQRALITRPPALAIRVQFGPETICERCEQRPAAWHCLPSVIATYSDRLRLELCDDCYTDLCDGTAARAD